MKRSHSKLWVTICPCHAGLDFGDLNRTDPASRERALIDSCFRRNDISVRLGHVTKMTNKCGE